MESRLAQTICEEFLHKVQFEDSITITGGMENKNCGGEVEFEESRMKEHLEKLRNLVLMETAFTSPTDDKFLIQFVRANKYNVDRANQQIRRYFEFKRSVPELVDDTYPTKFKGMFEELISVMKVRSKGRHLAYFCAGDWDPSRISLDQFACCSALTVDHMASFTQTQLNGIVAIFDFRGFGLTHILNSNPKRIQQLAKFVQHAYPASFKGFHVIHAPAVANILFAILTPFLEEKIRKRISFHGHKYQESLRKAIGADALPKFLGGNIPDDEFEDKDFYPSLYKKDEHYKRLIPYGFPRKQ